MKFSSIFLTVCAPLSVQAQHAHLETVTAPLVFWLQRHGESWNNVHTFRKMAEPYLTDKGKQDVRDRVPLAKEMLGAFGLKKFDIGFASSLRRTQYTALNMFPLVQEVQILKNLKEHHMAFWDKGNLPYESAAKLLEEFEKPLDAIERKAYNTFKSSGGFVKTDFIKNWGADASSQTTNFDEGVVPEFEKALSKMTHKMATNRPTHIYAATHSKMLRTWFKALGLTGEKIANGAFMVVRGQATWEKDSSGNVVNFKLDLHQKDGVGPDSVKSELDNGLDVKKLRKIWKNSSEAPNAQMKKRIEDMRRVLYQQNTVATERWTVTAGNGVDSRDVDGAPKYFFKISKGQESWKTEPMRFSVLVDKLQNVAKEMKKQGVNMSKEPSLPRRRMFHSNDNPDVIKAREDAFAAFMVWALENSMDRMHLLDQLKSQQTRFPVADHVWETFYTQNGKAYYYNHSTGVTQWERPAVLVQASASVDNSAQEDDDLQKAIEQSRRTHAVDELMRVYGINQEIADYVLSAANNDMARATELIFAYSAVQQNAVMKSCGMDSQFEPTSDEISGFNNAISGYNNLVAVAAC